MLVAGPSTITEADLDAVVALRIATFHKAHGAPFARLFLLVLVDRVHMNFAVLQRAHCEELSVWRKSNDVTPRAIANSQGFRINRLARRAIQVIDAPNF